tara:strand:- start:742 stop:2037 length:1296 start_codon:yes stop_codon:yes gene_type:complete
MRQLNIGICGLGTVGSGVLSVLQNNSDIIREKSSCLIHVTHVATRNTRHGCNVENIQFSKDIFEVAKDSNIDLVVELIGGMSSALELIMLAISNGKHVVTANKALISEHGTSILQAAHEANVIVAFEASVAGGIPILKTIREGLVANKINWLAGIINGTTNFILSEMSSKGRSFESVLEEAQKRGYAEADPTFDIEGIDASQKLSILTSMSFGMPLPLDHLFTEGITEIPLKDFYFAKELGFTLKHIGICRDHGEQVEARVHPALIPDSSILSNVNGVSNAVMVNGNAVDTTLYYGPGAGSTPTASSVISDIVEVAKSDKNTYSSLGFPLEKLCQRKMLDINSVECGFYVRLTVVNKAGVLSEITKIMADSALSIESIIQRDVEDDSTRVDIVLLSSKTTQSNLSPVLSKITELDSVSDEFVMLRVEYLDD